MKIKLTDLTINSSVQFGTSGVRGLVTDLTDKVCYSFTLAFLQHLEKKHGILKNSRVGIAGDLRKSTPSLMAAIQHATIDYEFIPINLGFIPTPALSLYGLEHNVPTIMITGSHIPENRNGIKFYTPSGEILKSDESEILNTTVTLPENMFTATGSFNHSGRLIDCQTNAIDLYIKRFLDFFPDSALSGCHIGVYEHSSVARDLLKIVLKLLGATVTSLGRSEEFVSVDTEAIRDEDVEFAKTWARQHRFTSIVSTDGDSDRPLISDENGNWLRGDIAGMLCAKYLNANTIVTPVSSNSAIEKSGLFRKTVRSKIGSPYVINQMQKINAQIHRVVGFEANGGFLQHSLIEKEGRQLKPLLTRDSFIVILSLIHQAKVKNTTISKLVSELPQRHTYSDRLKNIPTLRSNILLDRLNDIAFLKNLFFEIAGEIEKIDLTDGLRITFVNEEIIHLRSSGNAPELRCYTESTSEERAKEMNTLALIGVKSLLF